MCDFPAKALLMERRRVAQEADKTSDPGKVRLACEFVSAVDDARLAHEELTGCNCWQRALMEVEAA
jgi:hypothetical protein